MLPSRRHKHSLRFDVRAHACNCNALCGHLVRSEPHCSLVTTLQHSVYSVRYTWHCAVTLYAVELFPQSHVLMQD